MMRGKEAEMVNVPYVCVSRQTLKPVESIFSWRGMKDGGEEPNEGTFLA
jgi:hypothetical protein